MFTSGANGSGLPETMVKRIALVEAECAIGVCHHDATPANIVFSAGGPLLLDWEYAALGRPVLDWATLVADWQLPLELVSERGDFER